MKSAKIAIGVAASMAVTSVGFEARAATFLTQAECIALAKTHHARLVAACTGKVGMAYSRCIMEAYADYSVSMAICYTAPAPAAPPVGPPAGPPAGYKYLPPNYFIPPHPMNQ